MALKKNTWRSHCRDYTRGVFFITVVTEPRRRCFGRIENEQLIPTPLGSLIEDAIERLDSRPDLRIIASQVMPDHAHFMPALNGEGPPLGTIMRNFKGGCTGDARLLRLLHPTDTLWQRNYHDWCLTNPQSIARCRAYIEHNPRKWEAKQREREWWRRF
jgi:REP element-mobilizing transposase RayT